MLEGRPRFWSFAAWPPNFFYFTGFSGHRPAKREWARTGLIGPMQGAIPTQSQNPSREVGHTTGVCVRGRPDLRPGSTGVCHPYPIPKPVKRGWPHHRGLRPLLFSNSGVCSFTSHKNRSVKVLWDGTYGFLSLWTIADVITKPALSSQLFKDRSCWSGRGLNPRPPAQQTGALPTELTRRLLVLWTFPLCIPVLYGEPIPSSFLN